MLQCLISCQPFVKFILIKAATKNNLLQQPTLENLVRTLSVYSAKRLQTQSKQATQLSIKELSENFQNAEDFYPATIYKLLLFQIDTDFRRDFEFLGLMNLGISSSTKCKKKKHESQMNEFLVQVLELKPNCKSVARGVRDYFKLSNRPKCCAKTNKVFCMP